MHIARRSSILAALLALLLATSCAGKGKEPEGTVEKVRVQLYWNPTLDFLPLYVAQAQGYFEDENLAVELLPGGYDAEGNYTEVLPAITSGQAEFGLLGSDQILLARAQGIPVVSVATFFQRLPYGLASLSESNIRRPEDLIGKRILLWDEDLSFDIFLHNTGIDRSTVTILMPEDVGGYAASAVVEGRADVMITSVYEDDLAYSGHIPNIIVFDDYGVQLYHITLFTTEQMLAERPDTVQALVNAIVRSMRHVLDDPEAAAGEVFPFVASADYSADFVRTSVVRSLPLIKMVRQEPGYMNPAVWQSTADLMTELGLLDGAQDIGAAYDNRFVETATRQAGR